jgi:RNA polymerase sigma factor (sigma-70 family)
MATIARKQAVQPGANIREQLRTMDDSAVVTAFLGGEERAFSELVERYQSRLLNFVYRTIGDREKAEDLVQEVFIRVYRHLHRFDRSKKFSTWAYTIASNLAKNELRNRSRNPLVLFQTVQKNWRMTTGRFNSRIPHRDLMTCTVSGTCGKSWRNQSRSFPSITEMSSSSGSSRASRTRR